ncbi:M56 family metallopeptidase [Mycolicibacterium sp. CBM1]
MNTVTVLLTYAVTLTWVAPVALGSRLVAGANPRVGVAAWLVTVGAAVLTWMSALVILAAGALRSLTTHTAPTFCVEKLGLSGHLQPPAPLATTLVIGLLGATTAVAAHTVRRVIITLVRTRRSNSRHVEAACIVGRPMGGPGVVMVASQRPAVYCVAGGGRSVVVVTSAAVAQLDADGLAAVLDHERAHLRGRHHHITATLKGLAAALPRLPLMTAAARSVPTLLEMCADDAAVRRHGRAPLLRSMIALGAGGRAPVGALAAATTAVLERATRLARAADHPPRRPRAAVLLAVSLMAAVAPVVAFALCF